MSHLSGPPVADPDYVLPDDLRATLAQVGSATVANVLYRRFGMRSRMVHGVHPLDPQQEALVGPAYTLRFIPAREDLDDMSNYSRDDNLHRVVMETCPAGSVLVIETGGNVDVSSMGDMMALRLRTSGVAGVVTDGGFRDSPAVKATGLPAYQRQSAPPATPIAMRAIAIHEPIGCGGVAVYPGDVVVGDGEGVTVIPQHLVAEVAAEAYDAEQYEEWAAHQIRAGSSLFDVFPATEQSRAEYDSWVAQGRPPME